MNEVDLEEAAAAVRALPVNPPPPVSELRRRIRRRRTRRLAVVTGVSVLVAALVAAGSAVVVSGSPSSRVATLTPAPLARGPQTLRAISGVAPASSFSYVACHAPETCVALGPTKQEQNPNLICGPGSGSPCPSGLSVYATAGTDGRTWVPRGYIDGDVTVTALSCGGPTTCVAIGSDNRGTVVWWSTDTGRRWERRAVPKQLTSAVLVSISCVTADRCAVIGTPFTSPKVELEYLAVTSDGGRRWRVVAVPTGMDLAATCPSASVCYAWGWVKSKQGDGQAAALVKYSVASGLPRLVSKHVYPFKAIQGIACATPSSCAVIADRVTRAGPRSFRYHPLAAYTADGGSRWHFAPDQTIPSASWSVTCPTARVCVAAADFGASGRVLLTRTGNGGRSWQPLHLRTPVPRVSLDAASCASLQLCVAVGGGAQQSLTHGVSGRFVLISRNSAKTWQLIRVPR